MPMRAALMRRPVPMRDAALATLWRRVAAAALVWAVASGFALARPVTGVVVRVIDGDTLWLAPAADSKKVLKLRLADIDAPELCQPGGVAAREALAGRVLNQRVHIRTRAIDTYRRTIATVRLGHEDIGAWMVQQGHAWADRYRHQRATYAELEAQARVARRGAFADPHAQAPWLFRKRHGPCT